MAHLDEKYNFKKVRDFRASGILMHISSLPGKYGIGTLGNEARKFVDFLKEAGQTYWQILPVGPTGYGDSPYQSFSTYAGNPYLIDLEYLVQDSILTHEEIEPLDEGVNPECVDYHRLYKEKLHILKLAYDRFNVDSEDFKQFCNENAHWMDDYALFMAVKNAHSGKSWLEWEEDFKRRNVLKLKEFRRAHQDEISYYKFMQYLFFRQYESLKAYANSQGIKIIGDLPIYVSQDSVDTWANPQLFKLTEDLNLKFVGGCPPDAFSDAGQLWGNPCYDWIANEAENFKWWIERIRASFKIFDYIRIDHFRGFESFWQIPAGDDTAKNGNWELGPGIKLFNAVKEALGDLPIIAEDLGYMTKEVYEFREATGFPGMKILQFAFNPDASSDYLPHNITENSVVYTGTHDNDTIMGWFAGAPDYEVEFAKRYLNLTHEEGYNWGLIRVAMTSISKLAIFQMQDLFALDNSARMNAPGTVGGNWTWRMKEGYDLHSVAARLREYTRMSGRIGE